MSKASRYQRNPFPVWFGKSLFVDPCEMLHHSILDTPSAPPFSVFFAFCFFALQTELFFLPPLTQIQSLLCHIKGHTHIHTVVSFCV